MALSWAVQSAHSGRAGGWLRGRLGSRTDRDSSQLETRSHPLWARSQHRLKPPGGKLQGGEPIVVRRFALGIQDPCRERAAIHPPPGQQLEQLTRTQGCAARGVQVTVDRGEEQAHRITGGKAVIKSFCGVGSVERTHYVRDRCYQEETSFRKHSQESGDSVVNSVCRDCADEL